MYVRTHANKYAVRSCQSLLVDELISFPTGIVPLASLQDAGIRGGERSSFIVARDKLGIATRSLETFMRRMGINAIRLERANEEKEFFDLSY